MVFIGPVKKSVPKVPLDLLEKNPRRVEVFNNPLRSEKLGIEKLSCMPEGKGIAKSHSGLVESASYKCIFTETTERETIILSG